MNPYEAEIVAIKSHIIAKFQPEDILLFGSCAKRRINRHSDIDICVILATQDKRQVVMDILLANEKDVDLDIVVYTPEEWRNLKDNPATFAGVINQTGVSLLG